MFNEYVYLYVEDDPLSREVMQMIMVNAMGVERLTMFESSHNFAERIQQLAIAPKVVLLDIHIAPHNGFEMLAILRTHPQTQQARVIALTASVMNEEVERLRESGFDGAIAKPLSIQTFPDLIQKIINGESVWYIV